MIDTRKLLCAIYMSNRVRFLESNIHCSSLGSLVPVVLQYYENDVFDSFDIELAEYTINYFKGYLLRIVMGNGQYELNKLAKIVTSKTVPSELDIYYLTQQLSLVNYDYHRDIAEMINATRQKFIFDTLPYTGEFTFLFFSRKDRLLCVNGLIDDKQVELIRKENILNYDRYVLGAKFPVTVDNDSSGLVYHVLRM